ncbi:hypothetical protein OH77DRAFT_1425915 [Trametes cingulata]|nr:hypothetical protein OH77DRAFT_1425915 [Trametes cingulata]
MEVKNDEIIQFAARTAEEPPKKRARRSKAAEDPASAAGPSTSRTVKGRTYLGKLAGLLQVPMDVFFEIFSHLHPSDLLRASRTSKDLRSVLLSRKNRFVWVASLAGVEGLPPCPEDMSEPAYASLLFDRFCALCGATRPSWVDYAIRLRLCKTCYTDNIKTGDEILADVKLPMRSVTQKLFMAMTPCEIGKDPEEAQFLEFPITHDGANKYYIPQLKGAYGRFIKLREMKDEESVEDYLEVLFAETTRIHKHATAVLRWELEAAQQRQNEEQAMKERRKAGIAEKLKELGYGEDDFPKSKEWSKLVDQPKDLTNRIWTNLQPKLEVLLQEEKERKLREAYEERRGRRIDEIAAFYEDYARPLAKPERALLPNTYDACRLPCLLALAEQEDAHGCVSLDQFVALIPQMLEEAENYKAKAREAAVTVMLDIAYWRHEGSLWREELESHPAAELLTRHYALFKCDVSWNLEHQANACYLPYKEMHAHWRDHHPRSEWTASRAIGSRSICCVGDYYVGGQMLEAAGLARDTPISVLTELVRAGRLYCSCSDPKMPPPEELDWSKLFQHVYTTVQKYNIRTDALATPQNPKLVLKSPHSLSGPNACIKLLPEGASTAPARERATIVDHKTRKKIEERLATRPTPTSMPVCRICKALTARRHLRYGCHGLGLSEDPAQIVHHLRAWHEKEFEKRDILFWDKAHH